MNSTLTNTKAKITRKVTGTSVQPNADLIEIGNVKVVNVLQQEGGNKGQTTRSRFDPKIGQPEDFSSCSKNQSPQLMGNRSITRSRQSRMTESFRNDVHHMSIVEKANEASLEQYQDGDKQSTGQFANKIVSQPTQSGKDSKRTTDRRQLIPKLNTVYGPTAIAADTIDSYRKTKRGKGVRTSLDQARGSNGILANHEQLIRQFYLNASAGLNAGAHDSRNIAELQKVIRHQLNKSVALRDQLEHSLLGNQRMPLICELQAVSSRGTDSINAATRLLLQSQPDVPLVNTGMTSSLANPGARNFLKFAKQNLQRQQREAHLKSRLIAADLLKAAAPSYQIMTSPENPYPVHHNRFHSTHATFRDSSTSARNEDIKQFMGKMTKKRTAQQNRNNRTATMIDAVGGGGRIVDETMHLNEKTRKAVPMLARQRLSMVNPLRDSRVVAPAPMVVGRSQGLSEQNSHMLIVKNEKRSRRETQKSTLEKLSEVSKRDKGAVKTPTPVQVTSLALNEVCPDLHVLSEEQTLSEQAGKTTIRLNGSGVPLKSHRNSTMLSEGDSPPVERASNNHAENTELTSILAGANDATRTQGDHLMHSLLGPMSMNSTQRVVNVNKHTGYGVINASPVVRQAPKVNILSPNSHPAQNPVFHMQNAASMVKRYAKKREGSMRVSQDQLGGGSPTSMTNFRGPTYVHTTHQSQSQVAIELNRDSVRSPGISQGSERPNLPRIKDAQPSRDTDGLVIDPIPVEISDDEQSPECERKADGFETHINSTGASYQRNAQPMKLGDAKIIWAMDGIDKFNGHHFIAGPAGATKAPTEAEKDRYQASRTNQQIKNMITSQKRYVQHHRVGNYTAPFTAAIGRRQHFHGGDKQTVEVQSNSVEQHNEQSPKHNLTPRMSAVGRSLSGTVKSDLKSRGGSKDGSKFEKEEQPDKLLEVIMMNFEAEQQEKAPDVTEYESIPMRKDIAQEAKDVLAKARADHQQKEFQLPRSTLMQFPRRSNGLTAAKAHLYRSIEGPSTSANANRESRLQQARRSMMAKKQLFGKSRLGDKFGRTGGIDLKRGSCDGSIDSLPDYAGAGTTDFIVKRCVLERPRKTEGLSRNVDGKQNKANSIQKTNYLTSNGSIKQSDGPLTRLEDHKLLGDIECAEKQPTGHESETNVRKLPSGTEDQVTGRRAAEDHVATNELLATVEAMALAERGLQQHKEEEHHKSLLRTSVIREVAPKSTAGSALHQIPILTISNKKQRPERTTEDSIIASSTRNRVTVRGFDVWTDGTSIDMIRRSVQNREESNAVNVQHDVSPRKKGSFSPGKKMSAGASRRSSHRVRAVGTSAGSSRYAKGQDLQLAEEIVIDRTEGTVGRRQTSIDHGYSSEEKDADEKRLRKQAAVFHRLISIAAAQLHPQDFKNNRVVKQPTEHAQVLRLSQESMNNAGVVTDVTTFVNHKRLSSVGIRPSILRRSAYVERQVERKAAKTALAGLKNGRQVPGQERRPLKIVDVAEAASAIQKHSLFVGSDKKMSLTQDRSILAAKKVIALKSMDRVTTQPLTGNPMVMSGVNDRSEEAETDNKMQLMLENFANQHHYYTSNSQSLPLVDSAREAPEHAPMIPVIEENINSLQATALGDSLPSEGMSTVIEEHEKQHHGPSTITSLNELRIQQQIQQEQEKKVQIRHSSQERKSSDAQIQEDEFEAVSDLESARALLALQSERTTPRRAQQEPAKLIGGEFFATHARHLRYRSHVPNFSTSLQLQKLLKEKKQQNESAAGTPLLPQSQLDARRQSATGAARRSSVGSVAKGGNAATTARPSLAAEHIKTQDSREAGGSALSRIVPGFTLPDEAAKDDQQGQTLRQSTQKSLLDQIAYPAPPDFLKMYPQFKKVEQGTMKTDAGRDEPPASAGYVSVQEHINKQYQGHSALAVVPRQGYQQRPTNYAKVTSKVHEMWQPPPGLIIGQTQAVPRPPKYSYRQLKPRGDDRTEAAGPQHIELSLDCKPLMAHNKEPTAPAEDVEDDFNATKPFVRGFGLSEHIIDTDDAHGTLQTVQPAVDENAQRMNTSEMLSHQMTNGDLGHMVDVGSTLTYLPALGNAGGFCSPKGTTKMPTRATGSRNDTRAHKIKANSLKRNLSNETIHMPK